MGPSFSPLSCLERCKRHWAHPGNFLGSWIPCCRVEIENKYIGTNCVKLKRWELEEEGNTAENKVAGDSQVKREEKTGLARRLFCNQESTTAGIRSLKVHCLVLPICCVIWANFLTSLSLTVLIWKTEY